MELENNGPAIFMFIIFVLSLCMCWATAPARYNKAKMVASKIMPGFSSGVMKSKTPPSPRPSAPKPLRPRNK